MVNRHGAVDDQIRLEHVIRFLNWVSFTKRLGFSHFPWGDTVAFTGSANESWSGHSINSESVDGLSFLGQPRY